MPLSRQNKGASHLLLAIGFAVVASPVFAQSQATIVRDKSSPPLVFAAAEIDAALTKRGFTVTQIEPGALARQTGPVQVVLTTVEAKLAGQPSVTGLSAQGYALRPPSRTLTGTSASAGKQAVSRWWVIGADAAGAMYGGLDIAEAIEIAGNLDAVADREINPRIAKRGIKFNIPLDARTPSYSDDSTSAQANIGEMWDMRFWTEFLDEMARRRYNLLSLWSLSPFPSLVKVPEYPRVALTDVKKKSGALFDATLQGRQMFDESWPLETIKVMTIDQKIAFWRAVMEYARHRGVEVAIFTWNTFVFGTEASGYGITDSLDNATTRDYVRKSVRTLFNTYPLLAAIGITSGENMGDMNSGTEVKERWLWETYGLGVQDAMADARQKGGPFAQPNRKIRLIHRAHQSNLNDIVSHFRQLPGYEDEDSTLSFSFKYSQAHMYSSTAPQFIHQNGWFKTIPPGKKTWLTIRNDDLYYMRWGDPDFVRTYLTSLPDLSKIAGFYMGPDGYTWGREFVGTDPETPRQLVVKKMWFSFMLWGRLAYDPTIQNSHFERVLAARFTGVSSADLFAGWTSVSKIVPLMTRFYWGDLDFKWYPEASWSLTGYATVQDLITPKYAPMRADEDGQSPRLMSVKAFVDGDAPSGRLTPLEVADMLARFADTGLAKVEPLSPGTNKELRQTLADIKAMAWLGRYYADKIRGAVDLYRHQKSGNAADLDRARASLQSAAAHWRSYADLWSAHYVGQVLTRMGLTPVDIKAIQTFVDRDVPASATR
jgi:hypothetical protein